MAAMHLLAFAFLVVTLLGEGFDVTDEEFKVGFIVLLVIRIKFKLYLVKMRLLMSPYVAFLQDLQPLVAIHLLFVQCVRKTKR